MERLMLFLIQCWYLLHTFSVHLNLGMFLFMFFFLFTVLFYFSMFLKYFHVSVLRPYTVLTTE